MERLKEFYAAVERPLRYAQSGDAKKLAHIKNLSTHILEVSRTALSEGLPQHDAQVFRSLQEIFSGFDDLVVAEKRNRIRQALSILHPETVVRKEHHYRPEEHPNPTETRLTESVKNLSGNVQYLKGVGPSIASKLKKAGVETVGDLLMFFPHRYEDRRVVTKIRDLQEGIQSTVIGEVSFSGVAFYKGLRRRVYEVTLQDETGQLKLKWFHFAMGYLDERIRRGQKLIVYGKPKTYRSRNEMHHPEFEVFSGEVDSISFGKIVPVYREIGGLYQKTLRKILNAAVSQYAGYRTCMLPPQICKKQDLIPPWKAILALHQPRKVPLPDHRSPSERALSFEELFFYCLSLAIRKKFLRDRAGISFQKDSPRYQSLIRKLPFELTDAQKQVLKVIRNDMVSKNPMNRLLQGDVGSGKTVVALLASLIAIDNGYQVAFMAPTEVLAEQHLRTLTHLCEGLDLRIESLLGRHTAAYRRDLLKDLKAGKVNLLVGTHALLEEDVDFSALGLVVVDEQHRFGVRQRERIRSKAAEPDVLVMSATPIPRTLALTLYGDLDVSILNQLPKGRKPIETRLVPERNRADVYDRVLMEIEKGRQAYIVYPLVEASERLDAKDASTMVEEWSKIFPNHRVELIHGQLKSSIKEDLMRAFERHEIDILVCTTVIEVGIDVPNATVMVIEHPERFGLSQLHQLRGRVGRGSEKSSCILIAPPKISRMARDRLKTFSAIHDGFLLAEEDLRVRGPGDFFGVAQSGFPTFAVAVFPRDLDLLEAARQEAMLLLQKDPEMKEKENRHLQAVIDQVWTERLKLVRIG